MTEKDYTAVVLVVDRSGSMSSIAASVEDTLKEFVSQQLSEPGRLTIDTVFFDTQVENRAHLVDPAKDKLDLTLEPRGMTALFDAVGAKIDSFGKALAELPEEKRPAKVIFVIATDGMENSSTDYNQQKIAEMIGHQRDVYDWAFTFIGANQDAVLTARGLNIPAGSAITFAANKAGAENVLRSMSGYVAATRSGLAASYSASDRISAVADDAHAHSVVTPPVPPVKTAAPRKRAAAKAPAAGGEIKPKRAPRKAAAKDPAE